MSQKNENQNTGSRDINFPIELYNALAATANTCISNQLVPRSSYMCRLEASIFSDSKKYIISVPIKYKAGNEYTLYHFII